MKMYRLLEKSLILANIIEFEIFYYNILENYNIACGYIFIFWNTHI